MYFILIGSFLSASVLIKVTSRAAVTGRDIHKPGQPHVPEMGGLAIVAGFSAGILFTIGSMSFLRLFPRVIWCFCWPFWPRFCF